ncbi:MAG: hypothetical protein WC595_05550 [Candidatus Nanoarchaeia archaeon]
MVTYRELLVRLDPILALRLKPTPGSPLPSALDRFLRDLRKKNWKENDKIPPALMVKFLELEKVYQVALDSMGLEEQRDFVKKGK